METHKSLNILLRGLEYLEHYPLRVDNRHEIYHLFSFASPPLRKRITKRSPSPNPCEDARVGFGESTFGKNLPNHADAKSKIRKEGSLNSARHPLKEESFR
eukprot:TRINITY_DN3119_c0_g1_i1.p1 TRINITY_DN3119_c0_g1~~TRINITY_DN3119_c0_g1_i1.p1  ORF type:complete len:101 (+),score=5.20 TRINITY_DN3119_c0_g1_i1:348-650(+)